jgi:hypothetical protein
MARKIMHGALYRFMGALEARLGYKLEKVIFRAPD